MKYLYLILCCITFLAPAWVSADTVIRTAQNFELSGQEAVDGNLVAIGTPVVLSGVVNGDGTLVGNRVSHNGVITDDLTAAGLFVTSTGEVAGDVRIVGGSVELSGTINGDVLVLANEVSILSTAVIGGDVILYVNRATVAGDIAGSVLGTYGDLSLDSVVRERVDVRVNAFNIGATASVTESIRYISSNVAAVAPSAVLQGELLRNDPVQADSNPLLSFQYVALATLLFASCTLLFIARASVTDLIKGAPYRAIISGLVGLTLLILLPILIGVLSLTTVGLYVATILLLLYLLLFLVAGACVPILLGHTLQRWFAKRSDIGLMSVLFGGLVIGILGFVPQVLAFVYGLSVMWLAGAIVRHLWSKN